jgi:hypothetical protein
MKMRRGAVLGALALSVVGMIAAYRVGRARADGVPMVNPLYYGGMLDDVGRPLEGARNVTVRLWDASTAGTTVCTTNAGATTFSGGRFRVALDGACVGAVRANPELWAELQVEGTAFPRSKLGAVPYALEAGRATGAAGALEARLAAVEGRATGGRQVVVGSWRPTNPLVPEIVPLTICRDPDPTPGTTGTPGVYYTSSVEPMTISFTATATSLYRVTLPRWSSYPSTSVRLIISPPASIQFIKGFPNNSWQNATLPSAGYSESYVSFVAGQRYTISAEFRFNVHDCMNPLFSILTLTPFIIEQVN